MKDQLKILVLDDEPIVCKRLKPALEKLGYEVDTFTQSVEAMHQIQQTSYDIVITDLKMKEIDGMRFLEEVKKQHPQTEVIVITGFATMETAKQSFRKGVFDFIAKPFKLSEIQEVVNRAAAKIKGAAGMSRTLRVPGLSRHMHKSGVNTMIKTLVAIEVDLASSMAIRYACQLGDLIDLELYPVYVKEPPPEVPTTGVGWVRHTWEREIVAIGKEEIQEMLAAEMESCPILQEPRVIYGDREYELLKIMEHEPFDLYVEGAPYPFTPANIHRRLHTKFYQRLNTPLIWLRVLRKINQVLVVCQDPAGVKALLPAIQKLWAGCAIPSPPGRAASGRLRVGGPAAGGRGRQGRPGGCGLPGAGEGNSCPDRRRVAALRSPRTTAWWPWPWNGP